MSNIDEQFVEYIVKSLVGNPDAVEISRRVDEKGVLLELTVDPEDLGRIIGKRGATAQSLRTLLRALGTKNEARYNLKIVDNGPEGYERPQRDNSAASSQQTTVDDDNEGEAPVQTPTPPLAVDPSDEDDPADSEDQQSDFAKKHRQDLEDLDDLDI